MGWVGWRRGEGVFGVRGEGVVLLWVLALATASGAESVGDEEQEGEDWGQEEEVGEVAFGEEGCEAWWWEGLVYHGRRVWCW